MILIPGDEEERNGINISLRDLRDYIEQNLGEIYRHEIDDGYETYTRMGKKENGNDGQ